MFVCLPNYVKKLGTRSASWWPVVCSLYNASMADSTTFNEPLRSRSCCRKCNKKEWKPAVEKTQIYSLQYYKSGNSKSSHLSIHLMDDYSSCFPCSQIRNVLISVYNYFSLCCKEFIKCVYIALKCSKVKKFPSPGLSVVFQIIWWIELKSLWVP